MACPTAVPSFRILVPTDAKGACTGPTATYQRRVFLRAFPSLGSCSTTTARGIAPPRRWRSVRLPLLGSHAPLPSQDPSDLYHPRRGQDRHDGLEP